MTDGTQSQGGRERRARRLAPVGLAEQPPAVAEDGNGAGLAPTPTTNTTSTAAVRSVPPTVDGAVNGQLHGERYPPTARRPGADGSIAAPRRRRLTWEGAAYLALLLAAGLTRFWDLGSRALHHDESLHAYYSWIFATGEGYTHNPLMHGPFLFHANAFVYLLLGASDATSRFVPALFGIALVGLPWLLRGPRFLGRFGALTASALFLISPSFLYYSRYIRHDLYTVVGSLLLFTCLVRYVERPHRGWLVGAGACLAFLFTNHEIVFAIVVVFAGYLWGSLLWGRLRPLLPLQIAALALAGGVMLAAPRLPWFADNPLPTIPWSSPTREQELRYWRDLLTNPLVVTLLLILVGFVAACAWTLRQERRRLGAGLLDEAAPGGVGAAVVAAGRDRLGLWAALAVFLAIFATLFSSLFTNVYGLATGTVATDGTLLYWLGQQEVQRGSQPWYYFLYLIPQYEFFVVAFGLAAVAIVLWRTFSTWRDPAHREGALFARLWLVVWFGAIFGGLSYAGEKMPWLIVHIALPGTLLAAAVIGDLVERWVGGWQAGRVGKVVGSSQIAWSGPLGTGSPERRPQSRLKPTGTVAAGKWGRSTWVGPGLVAALLALAGGWWLLAADLSYGAFVRPEGEGLRRVVPEEALDRWGLLAVAPVVGVALVAVVWAVRGRAYAGRWAAVAVVAALALLQVHQAWRLSFLEGDIPRDSLIYNTTTPDVTRVVAELGLLSEELTGSKDLVILYDGGNQGVAWPFNWYFRDFPNAERIGASLAAPPAENVAVVIVADGHVGQMAPYLSNYTPTGYILRWHEPEYAIYRNFAIAPELEPSQSAWDHPDNPHDLGAILGSVGSSLRTQLEPEGQQRVWRLVMFREIPGTTMRFDFTVYVRNDLLPLLNDIRY